MITEERKAELKALGYEIEDMGEVYGDEWKGEYRWIQTITNDFQDGDVSCSEETAWGECDAYVRQLQSD